MGKKYYHATPMTNLSSIIDDGEIKTGCDGIVYLAESAEDALKFIALRCFDSIAMLELEVPDESKVIETFDHSYAFFKCRSFGYPENIPFHCMKSAREYPPIYST